MTGESLAVLGVMGVYWAALIVTLVRGGRRG